MPMVALPEWQPLRGDTPSIADTGTESGRVVAVVASGTALSDGWAPAAALDLARGWIGNGRRVIVVDAGLEMPSLHVAARIRNREGLTDAALHGASVGRISRPLDGGALFLVTAGGPVADPGQVARSGRWHRLLSGMIEAGVTVVLFLRDDDPTAPAFLGAASDIVVLAGPDDPTPSAVGDLAALVREVTGPASPAPPEPAPALPLAPVAVGEGMGRGSAWIVALVVIAAVAVAALGLALMSGGG